MLEVGKSLFNRITIKGIAVAVPQKKINIDAFIPQFGEESVRNFSKMTGVRTVHWSEMNQTASDLGFIATIQLLHEKNISPSAIGILIYVSQTPDYKLPATACVLHKRLKLPHDCIAFDINLGCSGYVYGLNIICSLMQSANIDYGLLVVGDTLSKSISGEDRSAIMLFGDAGSATLLKKDYDSAEIHTSLRTKGEEFRAIIQQAGGYRNPTVSSKRILWQDGNIRSAFDLYMDGPEVFNFTISEVPELINEFLLTYGYTPDSFDCMVLHQANLFILKQIAKKTKFPMGKVLISIDDYGNTSVTSIPLTLAKSYGQNTMQEQINVLMSGFGVGLSWGCVSATINIADIYPIMETENFYTEGGIQYD